MIIEVGFIDGKERKLLLVVATAGEHEAIRGMVRRLYPNSHDIVISER